MDILELIAYENIVLPESEQSEARKILKDLQDSLETLSYIYIHLQTLSLIFHLFNLTE